MENGRPRRGGRRDYAKMNEGAPLTKLVTPNGPKQKRIKTSKKCNAAIKATEQPINSSATEAKRTAPLSSPGRSQAPKRRHASTTGKQSLPLSDRTIEDENITGDAIPAETAGVQGATTATPMVILVENEASGQVPTE